MGHHKRKKKKKLYMMGGEMEKYMMGGRMEEYGKGGKMPKFLLELFERKKKNKDKSMSDGGRMYMMGGEMKELRHGGTVHGEEEELLAALNRANRTSEMERNIASLNDDAMPIRTESGFIKEGPDEGEIERLQMASETTNRVGGVPPKLAKMFLTKKGEPEMKMSMKKEQMKETPSKSIDKREPSVPAKTPPRVPGKRDPFEGVGFDMNTKDDMESRAVFNRGISQSGMRGEGTTGGFRGVRSDLVQDGMLKERGEVTEMSDLPDYIKEDPTFKNLVAEANKTKYQQDIGRRSGRFSDPGGQAAKDLADIMSGRITLEAYKERQNRASASLNYGGKLFHFGR